MDVGLKDVEVKHLYRNNMNIHQKRTNKKVLRRKNNRKAIEICKFSKNYFVIDG